MRDRTASRNYSPFKDEFRREHERRRAWGLKRRHAERLRRIQDERQRAAAALVEQISPAEIGEDDSARAATPAASPSAVEQLRHGHVDRADTGVEPAVPVTVAGVDPLAPSVATRMPPRSNRYGEFGQVRPG